MNKETASETVRQLLEGYGYETPPYGVGPQSRPRVALLHSTSFQPGGEERQRTITLSVGGNRRLALRNGLSVDPMTISCEVDVEDLAHQIEGARAFLAAGPRPSIDLDEDEGVCPHCGQET